MLASGKTSQRIVSDRGLYDQAVQITLLNCGCSKEIETKSGYHTDEQ
jgi:hypothetical protein